MTTGQKQQSLASASLPPPPRRKGGAWVHTRVAPEADVFPQSWADWVSEGGFGQSRGSHRLSGVCGRGLCSHVGQRSWVEWLAHPSPQADPARLWSPLTLCSWPWQAWHTVCGRGGRRGQQRRLWCGCGLQRPHWRWVWVLATQSLGGPFGWGFSRPTSHLARAHFPTVDPFDHVAIP